MCVFCECINKSSIIFATCGNVVTVVVFWGEGLMSTAVIECAFKTEMCRHAELTVLRVVLF